MFPLSFIGRRASVLSGVTLATLCVTMCAYAQTSFERELTALQDQREKAIAAVKEPIDHRYQASLEQLLRRATQAGDLNSALKVRQELEKFPGANDPRSTPADLIGLWELVDPLDKVRLSREIKPNGVLVSDAPPGGKWTINGNKLILTYSDPKFLDTFELPIRNQQLAGFSKAKHPLTLIKAPPKEK